MELTQKKGPAKDRHISAGQHNGHIKPDSQAQQKPDHTANYRAGHPERKPDESK